MQDFNIRKYTPEDKAGIMQMIRLNIPAYFAPEEAADLDHYLDHEVEQYFVVLNEAETLIGCGGINYFPEEQLARISWDIIHPEWQGKGVGSRLLQHRLDVLRPDEQVNTIMVRTSQLVYPFYEKNGFRLSEIVKDYWAPGFDLYTMLYQY
jgi:N-acetylglutamate synthase-like GNAT family acetyltransferase